MIAELIIPGNLPQRMGEALAQYQVVSGKTNATVLANQGKFFALDLYSAFKRDVPAKGAILARAKADGFSLGRRDPKGQLAGISDTAYYRAQRRMGGFKSILANVIEEDGRLVLQGVRVGKRGKRILGGRRGLGGSAVSGTDTSGVGRGDSVVLNRRAVQTVEEINLRQAGRRFLAVSFLYRRWLTQGKGDEKRRNLVNVQPRSSALPRMGEVNLVNDGKAQSLTLTSYVPGVAQIGEQRGRFGQAMLRLLYSVEDYIARKQQESLDAEIRRAIA